MEEKEKKEIIEKMNHVVEYSQGILADCTDIFYRLLEAKSYFIKMFGGLIYEFDDEITFTIGDKEKCERVSGFCTKMENKYGLFELSEFIEFEKEGFFQNRVVEDYLTSRGIKIKAGCKLLKCFKYFIDTEEKLRKIQDEASILIQEDKITGKLCLSVHPLDFLSSSENCHNWRSCHSLDGEFRAGNLSYMVDKCTFMAYLKSAEGDVYNLPNFPADVKWNSKKWRTLLFISDNYDMMFAGRQYPFSTESGIHILLDKLEYAFPKLGMWTNWQSNKIKDWNLGGSEKLSLRYEYIPVGNVLAPLKNIVLDNDPINPLHFNDLLKSSCYSPLYCYKKVTTFDYWRERNKTEIVTSKDSKIRIGGKVKCLCCGVNDITMNEIMSCIDCEIKFGNSDSESFAQCSCCGSRYLYDEGVFLDYEELEVCQSCFERYCDSCEVCGITAYSDSGGLRYDDKTGKVVCAECYDDIHMEDL